MTLRQVHRASAVVIAGFACAHIANHVVALAGVPAHISYMRTAPLIYRARFVEPMLLAAVLSQVLSGATLVATGWARRQGVVVWIQAAAGSILAMFLVIHVAAVLYGRIALNLDTNFYYAAAGFYVAPYQYFFAPYYFLAVAALFIHLGCAIYWRLSRASPPVQYLALAAATLLGLGTSLTIVLTLAGVVTPVSVPANYKTTYAAVEISSYRMVKP
jgi:succinate dehydrogenase/fumarate reductase cytochrome b subunit